MDDQQRWRIHDPHNEPNTYYVFTNEGDARMAILCLYVSGQRWEMDKRQEQT